MYILVGKGALHVVNFFAHPEPIIPNKLLEIVNVVTLTECKGGTGP